MADIFANTQPPAWLQDRARSNLEATRGAIGNIAGTLSAGFLNGMQADQSAPINPQTGERPNKGFGQGLWEARMNQQDPMWKLKSEQVKSHILAQTAQMEGTYALTRERNEETKAWMQDVPVITLWLALPPEKRRDTPVPQVASIKAMQAVQQVSAADDRYFNAKDANAIREQSTALAKQQSQKWMDWQSSYSAIDAPTRDAITSLGDAAYERGPNGNIIGPSAKAEMIYNDSPLVKSGTKPPFGIGSNDFKAWTQKKQLEANAQKSQSPLGKLIADRAAAAARGEDTSAYDAKLTAEKGMPQQIQLKNGEWATWMPGATTMHVLKDPEKEANAKAAYDKFRRALQVQTDYLAAEATGKIQATLENKYKLAKDVSQRQKEYFALFNPTNVPVPAGVQAVDGPDNTDQQPAANPSRFKVLEVK